MMSTHNSLFLEILDKSDRVIHRYNLTNFPVSIGRAYDNDVILDDPYVSSHHLRVEKNAQGEFEVVDVTSENGIYQETLKRKVERIQLTTDNKFRVGHTSLRLRGKNYVIASTLKDKSRLHALRNIWSTFFILLITMAAYAGYEYLSVFYEQIKPIKLIAEVFGTFIVISVWSGCWALANRVVGHQGNFVMHLQIAGIGATALLFAMVLSGYISFAFSLDSARQILLYGSSAVIIAFALYFHLRLATQFNIKFTALISIGLASFVCSFVALINLARTFDFSPDPEYSAYLKPLPRKLISGKTTEQFFSKAEKIKNKIDTSAKED